MKVSILGAGAFGSALAQSYAQKHEVTLWAHRAAHAKQMQRNRQNPKLPNVTLSDAITICDDLKSALVGCDYCLICTPLQSSRAVIRQAIEHSDSPVFVTCSKGIDLTNFTGAFSTLTDIAPPARSAVLTGPSFASDIAQGKPTALILAAQNGANLPEWQADLSTNHLRLYTSTDPIGAELGGALKNVVAIACGAAMGAGFGESARAAIMTRGFYEMQIMAQKYGAQPETLTGLSGFGDLCLTCTSPQSRNYKYGFALGQGQSFDPNITVEGKATALALLHIAQRDGLNLPIITAVAALTKGQASVKDIVETLMNRPLKKENP